MEQRNYFFIEQTNNTQSLPKSPLLCTAHLWRLNDGSVSDSLNDTSFCGLRAGISLLRARATKEIFHCAHTHRNCGYFLYYTGKICGSRVALTDIHDRTLRNATESACVLAVQGRFIAALSKRRTTDGRLDWDEGI